MWPTAQMPATANSDGNIDYPPRSPRRHRDITVSP